MRSKRLSRQLKKVFGDENLEDKIPPMKEGAMSLDDAEMRAKVTSLIENFPAFLDTIEESYTQFDEKLNLSQRSLELSSEELNSANNDLSQLNQTQDALVNSLGQGFFMFNAEGICSSVFSHACQVILEGNPAGRPVAEVLRIPEAGRENFKDWCDLLFADKLEFAQMAAIGPEWYEHSLGLDVSLEYKPVRDANDLIVAVVVVASDRTNEMRAKDKAEKTESFATMVLGILKNKHEFKRFITSAREMLEGARLRLDVNECRRTLHTLKGGASGFGMDEFTAAIHELETEILEIFSSEERVAHLKRRLPDVQASFDKFLNENREVLGEVLNEKGPTREVAIADLQSFFAQLEKCGPQAKKISEKYAERLMTVPLRKIIQRFESQLRAVCLELGKSFDSIQFVGSDLHVIPEAYDSAIQSIVHIFQNIAAHGIEAPAVRAALGKKSSSQVTVNLELQGVGPEKKILIAISDDGAGIDVDKLRQKISAQKGASVAQKLSNQEVMNSIFNSGVSTASEVTSLAGLGVGLSAVQAAVESLDGSITVQSTLGKGTTFKIVLPWIGPEDLALKVA